MLDGRGVSDASRNGEDNLDNQNEHNLCRMTVYFRLHFQLGLQLDQPCHHLNQPSELDHGRGKLDLTYAAPPSQWRPVEVPREVLARRAYQWGRRAEQNQLSLSISLGDPFLS